MTITKEQRRAVYRVWCRAQEPYGSRDRCMPYREFRKHYVFALVCSDGAIVVDLDYIYLAIETDGHTELLAVVELYDDITVSEALRYVVQQSKGWTKSADTKAICTALADYATWPKE